MVSRGSSPRGWSLGTSGLREFFWSKGIDVFYDFCVLVLNSFGKRGLESPFKPQCLRLDWQKTQSPALLFSELSFPLGFCYLIISCIMQSILEMILQCFYYEMTQVLWDSREIKGKTVCSLPLPHKHPSPVLTAFGLVSLIECLLLRAAF